MRITVLAGGIGGARFLTGLRTLGHDITVIGNNGDDVTMYGLRICPDLDTVMYTLGGGISAERGWGREDETFRVRDDIGAYVGASGTDDLPSWFGLGDLDLATHLVRAHWLAEGVPLSAVTARLCARWDPGVRLLPSTDDRVETHVTLAHGERVHFQEWWVRLHASVPATAIELFGASEARPAPGVLDAIAGADVVVLPPSNPVVSVGTILAVPGIRDAVVATSAPVVGVSPIVGGAPVRGMADACLAAIGVETSAYAVARHYGELLDGWLVDEGDKADADRLNEEGLPARAAPLLMTDVDATARIADAALSLAADVRK
ncbi:MAG: 2-phospho-L-lactate transferase [Frankiaceae bacterium]|jgi:LPPG:FO 2-phospho-L-lactate transferase|nr:2-phospho-L-lactate transferase [Frankiaceae bacterium]